MVSLNLSTWALASGQMDVILRRFIPMRLYHSIKSPLPGFRVLQKFDSEVKVYMTRKFFLRFSIVLCV